MVIKRIFCSGAMVIALSVASLPQVALPERPVMAPSGSPLTGAEVQLLEKAVNSGVQPALEVPFPEAVTERLTFPTYDARGREKGTTDWRVARGTGNGAENYLATTKEGVLLDFGGEWLRISRDEGRTWTKVIPDGPLGELTSNLAEGTVAVAPDGDIVGVGWFVTAGDLILTFKYEADTEEWRYSVTRLGMAGFDRPSIAVLPGPFTIGGQTVPYVSVLRGGFLAFKPTFYSLDGLTYTTPRNRAVESLVSEVKGPLDIKPWKTLDWMQPHDQTGVTPLGPGQAIAGRGILDFRDEIVPRSILDPGTLRWSRYRFPDGGPPDPEIEEVILDSDGRLLADSTGALHHVQVTDEGSRITYMLSRDGGATWSEKSFPIFRGFHVDPYYRSLSVSGKHQTAVLVVHAVVQDDPLVTRDVVYRFDTSGATAKVEKIYVLGEGDFGSWGGGTETIEKDTQMDFSAIALLPDGRIAVSFTDYRHWEPSIAIELKGRTKPDRVPQKRVLKRIYTSGLRTGAMNPGLHEFVTSIDERSVRIQLDDALGQPVSFRVAQIGPDDQVMEYEPFCGEPDSGDLPIRGGWSVWIMIDVSDTCALAQVLATTGTMTVTFKR